MSYLKYFDIFLSIAIIFFMCLIRIISRIKSIFKLIHPCYHIDCLSHSALKLFYLKKFSLDFQSVKMTYIQNRFSESLIGLITADSFLWKKLFNYILQKIQYLCKLRQGVKLPRFFIAIILKLNLYIYIWHKNQV